MAAVAWDGAAAWGWVAALAAGAKDLVAMVVGRATAGAAMGWGVEARDLAAAGRGWGWAARGRDWAAAAEGWAAVGRAAEEVRALAYNSANWEKHLS